jgi:hypothetical protein
MIQLKTGKTNMIPRKLYRDGVEEDILGPIRTHRTSDGHTVESYKTKRGKRRFFATIAGTHLCAHGDTIAQAISDAIWKDPINRPSKEALVEEICLSGRERKISLNEFRLLTGACLAGCRTAMQSKGIMVESMTAVEIRDCISTEWGERLLSILEWNEVKS